ncbi:MAG: hypothetical protein ACKO2V_01170 [Snowella sp.]
MTTKLNHTILAYLLALQDLPHALNEVEQSRLKEVAKQLRTQPEAWNDYIEPSLVAIIQGNSSLNQSYQQYKNKLDNFGEISSDLLPTAEEINQLVKVQTVLLPKGFISDLSASGYEQQLNNVVIVVNQTEKPEEAVKQLGFLDKVKQLLN